jgi:hypothetical protein
MGSGYFYSRVKPMQIQFAAFSSVQLPVRSPNGTKPVQHLKLEVLTRKEKLIQF